MSKTTTKRISSSFEVPAGASRDDLTNGWMAATRDLQTRATEEGLGTVILWDMVRVEYHEEERDDIRSISGDAAAEATWPARIVISVPIVVTT